MAQKLLVLDKMRVAVTHTEIKSQKHLKGTKDAIDFDQFAEFIIENYSYLEDEKELLIKDVYLAVDVMLLGSQIQVNNDGVMSFNEFKILMKNFYNKSTAEIWQIFEDFAKAGLDSEAPSVKYLTLESFIQLSIEKDLFDYKSQLKF